MKRKCHTPQQVVRKLQEAQAALAADQELAAVCQMLGISEQTYYRWKNKYGGMKAAKAKRVYRLWRREGLKVARKARKQRAKGGSANSVKNRPSRRPLAASA